MSDLEARALDLFDTFVELPPSQRVAALAPLKAHDPDLHDALLKLLAADASMHLLGDLALDVLKEAHAVDDEDPSSTRIGNRLGPWRIDRVLESGGMGTVYEASRVDGQYEKRVALKCMRAEMSSPALIDAFMRERNHLAQLDHPHIAPLLDGGIEADGRPWFAMRLVQGTAMDLWADQQHLSLADRVGMLLQACQALRYAHARSVLHQDIKPGNLLVSADGRVHLVDFGLSAVMGGLDGSLPPRIAISNGYTAPEVVSGATASAASDIYSIGVMLYQLLVGDWPRPLLTLNATLVGLSNDAPARAPSMLAKAAPPDLAWKRGCRHAAQLQKRLQGDLDAIALKAVARVPEDRYPTVAALIDDLERWLAQRPVTVRGSSHVYVMQRFLQRNALASALAAGVVVIGATGAGVLSWLHLRDRQALHDTQAVSAVFEQTLGAVTLSGLADARPSSRHTLEKTEQDLRALPLHASPAIKARAFASLARSYVALGDYPRALALASEANRLLADSATTTPDTPAMLAMLLNLQARHAEARDVATQALQQSASTQAVADPATLALLVELARAHWDLSEYDAAFDALTFAQESAPESSSHATVDARIELLLLRGQWHLQLMQLEDAERDLQRAAATSLDHASSLVDDVREARLPLLLLQRRHAEATELAATLLASRRQRLGREHPDTARSQRLQLEVAEHASDAAILAPAAMRAAHHAIASAYGTRHPEYARQLMLEARASSDDDAAQALSLARQAVQLLEATVGPRHPTTLSAKEDLARALVTDASMAGDHADAQLGDATGLLQEVIHANGQRHWPAPTARYWLARTLLLKAGSTGSLADGKRQAETLLQDALVEASRHLGKDHATTAMIRDALVRDYPSGITAAMPSHGTQPSRE